MTRMAEKETFDHVSAIPSVYDAGMDCTLHRFLSFFHRNMFQLPTLIFILEGCGMPTYTKMVDS